MSTPLVNTSMCPNFFVGVGQSFHSYYELLADFKSKTGQPKEKDRGWKETNRIRGEHSRRPRVVRSARSGGHRGIPTGNRFEIGGRERNADGTG